MLRYEKVVKHIVKYLLGTRHIGTQVSIDLEVGLLSHADSDLSNVLRKLNPEDMNIAFSQVECVIFCLSVPII